jgi:MFS family permease
MRRPIRLLPDLPRAAWVLLGGDSLSALGTGLTLPFLLVYLHQVRGIEIGLAGLAVATIAVAGLAGNPVGGSLSDRFGPRNALIFGLLIAAAGAGPLAFVAAVWQAFGAAAVVGFGAAVIWPAQDSLLASIVAPEQRSSAFSLRHATLNAGFATGTLASALIVEVSSPGTFELVYLLDAVSFLAFVPVLLLLPSGAGHRQKSDEDDASVRAGYRQIWQDKLFRRLWLLMALLVAIGYAQTDAAFPAYVTGPGGLGASDLAIAVAANMLAVVGFQLVVLKLMAGRRRTRAAMLVCVSWAAAWAVTLLAGRLGDHAAGLAMFSLAMVLVAIGETLVAPTMPALANDLAPDSLRGRYNGAFTLAWTTGFILGPAIAGLAFAAGLGEALFVALIAACAIAGLGFRRLERQLPQHLNVVGRGRACDTVGSGAGEVQVVAAA